MTLKRSILFISCILLCIGLFAQHSIPKSRTIEVPSWAATLSESMELHGYAQAGYTWRHQNEANTNTFDIKRVLFWAKANVTERWSFLFMHDFSSVVQEFYTDYRFTHGKELIVR